MKKAASSIVLMLLLISILASAFIIQPVKAEPKIVSRTFSDDFSKDTGMWEYLGFAWPSYWGEDAKYVAYRDAEKGYVVLTPIEPHLAGVIWFGWEFTSPFTVNFKYLAGGGSGADGLVMMFYHEKPPYLWSGACLSFIGSGYGIEFDNHYNYLDDEYGGPPITDPSENHIAIVKDNPSNHLIYVDDQRTEDNVWHSVTVNVDHSSITVYVDSQQVIQWQGTIDRTYGGFGFAGTTGGLTNQHLIDDFSITIWASIWTVDDDGPADFHTIQEAINAANPGDTIYVKQGTYYENVVVNKRVLLVGEDSKTTVIDGGSLFDPNRITVLIDQVYGASLRNFTIRNGYIGIEIHASLNTYLTKNNITGNSHGVASFDSPNTEIDGNEITNNYDQGIIIWSSPNSKVTNNDVTGNNRGIMLDKVFGVSVVDNKVKNNNYGILLHDSSNNLIYHNNFINNRRQVYEYSWDFPNISPSVNVWDDGYPSGGNYWSDYTGVDLKSGPNQDQPGSDGIGDTPYIIDANNIDRYPRVFADIFDFPIGKPRSLNGSGFVTERNDGDGWYNAQDFGEYNSDMKGYHPGEDWNTETGGDTDIGELVYAVANGILYAKRSSLGEGLGGGIVIKHFLPDGGEVYSVYVHIEPNQNLNVEQVVARGEQIGRIADIKYPAHLHFEIRTRPVDPNDWYPNDIGNGYYESVEKMQEDGFTDPSYFIGSHFGRIYGIPVEFRFTRDLSKGMDNPEVRYLQILLNLDPDTQVAKSGIGSAGSETTYFGDLTENAVKRFQEKYFKDILEPAGLPSGNGYVGYYTRKKLNEILEMFFTPLYKELHGLCDMEERKSLIWKYIKEFKSNYLPQNFPNELILAVATQETGEYAHWNNEHVADDWGRGIMQITTNSYVGAGGVDSTSEECIKARNREGKIYSSMYYSNTPKGIEANIKDGLYALGDKYQQVKEDKIQPPEGYTKDEIIWMSTVQRYNGFRANPSEYIWHIGDKLIRLANGEYGDFEGFNREFARSLGEKFKKAYNERITLYSPAQLRVYDTYGNVAGLVNGEIREDIPNSIYDNETRTVLIFFPSEDYLYNVIGIDEGTYGLNIESFKEGESVSFTATEIPISTNATHQYAIDWDALSRGEEGVTVQVDSDGDGVFEHTFTSDSELTHDEFLMQTISWEYVFKDPLRHTILKISTDDGYFQFITPDKDYGVRNATYMRVYKRTIIVLHEDGELRLITLALDITLDFCVANAWDVQTGKRYFLIDKVGIED
jgi:parallel beta-helix repeat protein